MTAPVNDGGPAFPPNAGWRDNDPACRGMSLRAYFAGQAMAAIVSTKPVTMSAELLAKMAVHVADALIARLQADPGRDGER